MLNKGSSVSISLLRLTVPSALVFGFVCLPANAEESVSNLAERAGASVRVDMTDDEGPASTDASEELPADAPEGSGAELSFFRSRPLVEAHDAFLARRYALAQKRLAAVEGKDLPARYLSALIDSRLGKHQNAAVQLSLLATEWPLLSDLLHYEAGQAFDRARRGTEAATEFAAVSVGSRWFAPARLAWAAIEKRQRHFDVAISALSPLVSADGGSKPSGSTASVWMEIADLARLLGDFNGEHRALLATWALFPKSPQATAAQRRLIGLPYPPKWKLARAETLLSLNLNAEAMDVLDPLLTSQKPPEALGCRAYAAQGTALRKERKHARAIQVLRQVVAQCQDPVVRPRALYILGYSESVIDPTSAITTYETLAREFPDHPQADDALFYAADLRRRQGSFDAAKAALSALAERYPSGDFAAQALFGQFWISRQQGQVSTDSLEKLEALPPGVVSHEQRQRSRYWRARTLEQKGLGSEANALFADIAAQGGNTFYGLMARTRMETTSPDQPSEGQSAMPLPQALAALEAVPAFQRGLTLLRLGHKDAAAELLSSAAESPGPSLRVLFDVLTSAKRAGSARSLARLMLRQGGYGFSRSAASDLYAAAYPTPYRKLIERHSRSAGVSADLMQALVREESAFNPRARSTTGALGLAQLMPQTAARVAQRLRVEFAAETTLFEPSHNLRLGSAYLGELKRQFNGNLVFAVASYNAGPHAVNSWRRKLADLELDEWVEEVPVEETRHYVKRVLGSFGAYQRLAGVVDHPTFAVVAKPASQTATP